MPVRGTPSHIFRILLSDTVSVIGAWYFTLFVRLRLNEYLWVKLSQTDLVSAAPPLIEVMLVWTLVGLWLRRRWAPQRGLATRTAYSVWFSLETAILAGAALVFVTFLSREFGADLSRSFVLLFIPTSFISLVAVRHVTATALRLWKSLSPSRERVAVVSSGPEAMKIIDTLRAALESNVAGVIVPAGHGAYAGASWMPVLGRTTELAEVINRERLDRIVIADQHISPGSADEWKRVSSRMGVVLSHVIQIDGPTTTVNIKTLPGLQLLECVPLVDRRQYDWLKRLFDLIVSTAALIALSPLLLIIGLLIKATSKGPLLYRSTRVGLGGRHFTFLKFRSMRTESQGRRSVSAMNEKSGHLFKIKNDPRITWIGRYLRRFSLDELPQLINVLKGEMSIVGPRPLPAEDLAPDGQSTAFALWARERSRVLPGITGLWQIRGRSELEFEKMVEYDVSYVRDWCISLDCRILLETPRAVLVGRGAY